MSNFLQNLLNAVNKDQSTMQWMQISDTNSTEMDARMEEQTYTYWNTRLSADAAKTQSDASKGDTSQAAYDNQLYTTDSSSAQASENSADSTTQAAQQATGQDGTNLQNQAQLAQALNTISSNLASLIGHAYS